MAVVNSISGHVGSRIRLYRRSRGLNLEDLAVAIGKSKATVSKYESGQVAIDIATFCAIADVLEVEPAQLLDYIPHTSPKGDEGKGSGSFVDANQLYLYHLHQKKIFLSVLRLGRTDGNGRREATLFYKAESVEYMERCDCIYHGGLYRHDTVLSAVLSNYHNAVENILINVAIPIRKTDRLMGMISGLGVNTMVPTAYKVVLSAEPLVLDDTLREQLTIAAETFRVMRHNNQLFVPLG